MPLNLFFGIGVIACVIVAIIAKLPALFILAVVFYIANIVEACCSKTNRYLKNKESAATAA